ncbi:MAG: hypothetical protein V4643_10985 [Bacteroidota bacterium]
MLTILATWLLLFIINYLLGYLFKHTLKFQAGFGLQTLLGLILTSVICGSAAFFAPVNQSVLYALIIIALSTGLLFYKNIISECKVQLSTINNTTSWSIIITAAICLAAYSSGYSKINDDGLYYIQTGMWLNKYGFIHGLSNLHVTLGLCSSWHILQAVFSFSNQIHLNDLNGFILLIYLFYTLENYEANTTKIFSLLQLTIVFILSIPFLSAPNPDWAVIVISAITFDLFYNKINKQYIPITIVLAAFTVSIKFSAIALIILSLYCLYNSIQQNSLKKIAPGLLFASVIITLLIAKNIYQTGYPVYPYKPLALTQLDYTTPREIVAYYSNGIKTWAISDKFKPNDVAEVNNINNWSYIKALISRGGIKGFINILILLIAISISSILLLQQIKKYNSKPLSILHFVNIISILVWLLIAPQYRFALPMLLFYIAWIGEFIINKYIPKLITLLKPQWLLFPIAIMIIIALVGFDLGGNDTSKYIGKIEKLSMAHLLKPMPQYPFQYDTLVIDKQQYYYTYNNRYCWDAPLPCLPESYERMIRTNFNYTLQSRSSNVTDGFKYVSIPNN